MKNALIKFCLLAAVWLQTTQIVVGQNHYPGATLGAGDGLYLDSAIDPYNIMKAAKVKVMRLNIYPSTYFDPVTKTATPENIDQEVKNCYTNGLTPFLLCELYPEYWDACKGYDDWYKVGRAMAERFRPNSTWLKSQGISNWGIMEYSAFNEPDVPSIPDDAVKKAEYVQGLKGFADGIHAVDASLIVMPGGFSKHNSASDWTLRGLGTALAPLWNDGTLQAIDLHDYFGKWAPPFVANYNSDHRGQRYFDNIKKACGITKDILFYCTEMNLPVDVAEGYVTTEEAAAPKFLTILWDHLGIVGNDGKRPVAGAVMPFSLFVPPNNLDIGQFAFAYQVTPDWVPNKNGKVIQLVSTLCAGMYFTSLDPKTTGTFVLNGNNKKLWVWQNWDFWTSLTGTSFQVTNIPAAATKLEVYDWTGLIRTIPLGDEPTYTVTNLARGNTFMIVANAQDSASPATAGIVSGGTYLLLARHSGKALGVDSGKGQVQQYTTDANDANQQWVVDLQGDRSYKLTLAGTSNVLDVQGNSTQNDARVQLYPDKGTSAQRWVLTPTDSGYYTLAHQGTTTQVLDVPGASQQDGVGLIQYQAKVTNNYNQQWKLVRLDPAAAANTAHTNASLAANSAPTGDVLQAYPNPSPGPVTLRLTAKQAQPVTVHVHNAQGRVVSVLTVPAQAGQTDVALPTRLPPGTYFLRATLDGHKQVFTLKVE